MAAERVIRVRLVVDAPASNDSAARRTSEGLTGVASAADRGSSSLLSFANVAKTAVVVGVGVAVKSVLSLGMAYQDSLNTLQAVSGASAETMTQVSDAAKALGNDVTITGASAVDAAAAMTELAKGGLTVQESMDAARGTLQLAAAAQIDGAQAAGIQSAALNTFGLAADQAGRVADVLANAANASSGEITDFAAGLAQSGLAAKAMGISVEDTATVLGLFANNGLSGSDAGTSFKTMLISLSNPSKQAAAALEELGVQAFDAQGNFVGMRTVTEQLSAAQAAMTTEQFNAAAATAFGTDALRAAVAVAEGGTEAYDSMSTAVGKTGGAAELAAANSKGLSGAVDSVKNAAQTAALTLFESLSPALDTATRGIAAMIPGLADDLGPALSEAGLAFVKILDAVLPLVPILVNALAPALSAAASAIANTAVNVGPLITKFGQLFGDVLVAAVPVVNALGTALSASVGFLADLPVPILAGVAAFVAFSVIASTLGVGLVALKAKAIATGLALKAAFTNPIGIAILGIVTAVTALGGSFSDTEVEAHDFAGAIDEVTGAVDGLKIKDVVPIDVLRRMQDAGVAAGDYTAALGGNADAQQRVIQSLGDYLSLQDGNLEGLGKAQVLFAQYRSDLDGVKTATDNWSAAQAEAASGTFIFAGSAKEADQAIGPLLSALGGVGTTSAAAAPEIANMSDVMQSVADESSSASDALDYFSLIIDQLSGRTPNLEDAMQTLNDALRGVTDGAKAAEEATAGNSEALVSATGVIDTTTEAGSKLRDSFEAFGDASKKATDATFQQTLKTDGLSAAVSAARVQADANRASFIEMATQQNISADVAAVLADHLGLVAGVDIPDKTFEVEALGLGTTQADLDVLDAKTIADKIFTITTQVKATYTGPPALMGKAIDNASAVVGFGYTGGLAGSLVDLPGFARGGLLPGRPPSNPMIDNLLGSVGNRLIKIRSGEFIQPQPAVEFYGLRGMQAIQQRKVPKALLEGYAGGGMPSGMQANSPSYSSSTTTNQGGATFQVSFNHYGPGEVAPDALKRALRELTRTDV